MEMQEMMMKTQRSQRAVPQVKMKVKLLRGCSGGWSGRA
jgi:hypothetical protein